MKNKWRKLICGLLSVGLASTLIVEQTLRLSASSNAWNSETTASADVGFKDVTGSIDTSALRESQLNNSVLKNTDTTPTYETRTVMITLSGDSIAEASNMPVNAYLNTFTGQNTLSNIRKEQNAFLRKLKQAGIAFKEEERYETLLNAVAVEVNTQYVSQIKKMEGVESVVITSSYAEPKTITTQGTQEVFNQTSVYDTGIYDTTKFTQVEADGTVTHTDYGEGAVIAILDTGLDYTHEAFQRQPQNPVWAKGTKSGTSKETVTDKLNNLDLRAEERSNGLETKDVYVSEKIPFAYDYADDDGDVYPSYSNHGTHVAGIIGGYTTEDVGYTDKDGNDIAQEFRGVVPDSQLVICKVFTDDLDDKELGGAKPENIIAALEDCVKLQVDVINMSLGTSCGFTTTNDGDDEGEMLNAVYEAIKKEGISLVCAASNDFSSGYGGVYGTNLKENPDSSTVGSPSTFASALSVASISGQESPYMVANEGTANESFVFFEESRDENSNPFDFVELMLGKETNGDGTYKVTEREFEYVVVPGTGEMGHYSTAIKNKLKQNPDTIVLVKRGDSTFEEKVRMASRLKARAIIVYNNVAGVIRMNLGEIEESVRIPAISIDMDAGNALIAAAKANSSTSGISVGKITVSRDTKAGPFMSEFSSWGPTHDLKLKPEITAHGGEITSTVPGGYGEQSGTSMASPNMAGVMAIVRNYIKANPQMEQLITNDAGEVDSVLVNRLANQLIMSTATTVRDQAGRPYSPRKQGAGLGSLDNVVNKTSAYLWVDNADSATNDYRPKLEIGDDPQKTGVISKDRLTFKITNFGNESLSFTPNYLFFTETVAADGLAIAEQAHALDDIAPQWYVDGKKADSVIEVSSGKTVEISVELTLSDEELEYMGEKNFPSGMFLEGYLKLTPTADNANQCELSIPFLGFHGDWEGANMLDYTAYEVAADEADPSLEDKDKRQASVWATQPYSIYYNEKYILPMGSYVYLQDEYGDDYVYTDEKYNAVSCYNEYYGDNDINNYLTSTGIKAVYAGLLRNSRLVTYSLTNVQTGEKILIDEEINRVGKAYAGGGSGVPANVEFNLYPQELGLLANGEYCMDFVFYMNDPEKYTVFADDPNLTANDNPNNMRGSYSFTFTVDYEAPVLEDARVRYKTTKDSNGKEQQTIYLDMDVYDNHYAQALMLCYPIYNAKNELVLQLATEYATPVRSQTKNGTTTVSIDITDIYDKYKSGGLYVQIDDYAVNTCLYHLDLEDLQGNQLPDNGDFALAEGEENITLDIYDTHKVKMVYAGDADLSNFTWSSDSPQIADVKNGEIVGLSAGTATITVNNRKDGSKKIKVTVTDTQKRLAEPKISFGVIETDTKSLAKAEGTVEVNAGKTFNLQILKDPWYHPMTGLNVRWTTSDSSVASIAASGNGSGDIVTHKKGIAIIEAQIFRGNVPTLNKAQVTLNVVDEFDVSNYMLTAYNGIGYNKEDKRLWIPTDMNIMTIGEDAFKDNKNIEEIIIPASVTDIREGAFENCTNLKAVYFVDVKHRESVVNGSKVVDASIDWADLSLVLKGAFKDCKKLKTVDLSNTKTVTIAQDCFANCISLENVIKMDNMGTIYHRAFQGCTSLKQVDISGTFVMGENVFEGCTNIQDIKTGRFTRIGTAAFKNCTGLSDTLTLYTPNIGAEAFAGCVNMRGVKFVSPTGVALEFDIGDRAFENCGTNTRTKEFKVDFGNEIIRTIGVDAFAGGAVTEISINDSFDLDAMRLGGMSFNNVTVKLADRYNGDKYAEENGVIYNQNKSKLLLVNTALTGTFEVPNSVTEIGAYAFANSKLSTVTFADASNITAIGEGAFRDALKLTALDISQTEISVIPAYAFYQTSLASLTLPNSVTEIGGYAFNKSAITTMYMPSVERIGEYAFAHSSLLSKVTTADTAQENALTLSSDWIALGEGAFYNCASLASVELPSVKEMGLGVFANTKELTQATFGEASTATGTYTFMDSGIQSFTFANGQIEVGEKMFKGCTALTSVTLSATPSVEKDNETIYNSVHAEAFNGCEKLTAVNNLDKVVIIGEKAFYNTALTSLQLDNATQIAREAFAVDENKAGTYTQISMGKVQTIGAYAFRRGSETVVDLPASVTDIGYGAFASSENLKGFTVATGNDTYFVLDTDTDGYGVLYSYIDKDAKTYEIVCYPANRVQAETEGKAVYTIADGTVYVYSSAFLDITGLDGVVLPHSINAIGDDAFFNSGIKEYTFESVQAPVLETKQQTDVAGWIKAASGENSVSYYKGYYYTNFETYFYHFTKYGTQTSDLVMYYPANGIGYNNHIYKGYFGTRAQTGIVKTDTTRDWIATLATLSADTIRTWLTWDETDADKKAEVVACGELIKSLRSTYSLLSKDAGQAAFVKDKEADLVAVETAIREVKSKFGVVVNLQQYGAIIPDRTTFKTEYKVGETFDWTGMQLTLNYEDGTSRVVGTENLTLLTTSPLGVMDQYVEILYEDEEVSKLFEVDIKVTKANESENTPVTPEVPNEPETPETDGEGMAWWLWLIIGVGAVAVCGGCGGALVVLKGKKKAKNAVAETADDTSDVATVEPVENDEEETKE